MWSSSIYSSGGGGGCIGVGGIVITGEFFEPFRHWLVSSAPFLLVCTTWLVVLRGYTRHAAGSHRYAPHPKRDAHSVRHYSSDECTASPVPRRSPWCWCSCSCGAVVRVVVLVSSPSQDSHVPPQDSRRTSTTLVSWVHPIEQYPLRTFVQQHHQLYFFSNIQYFCLLLYQFYTTNHGKRRRRSSHPRHCHCHAER